MTSNAFIYQDSHISTMTENAQDLPVLLTLKSGVSAVIDDSDLAIISRYTWSYNKQTRYACCNVGPNGHTHPIPFHSMLINAPKGMYIDHINGDRLDNRRANLRVITPTQSRLNSAAKRTNTSGYKGVTLTSWGKWAAEIWPNSKHVLIGYFDDKVAAALAYDAKAKELYGEYARLNF